MSNFSFVLSNILLRCHAVSQFNRGVYSVIVAADEKFLGEFLFIFIFYFIFILFFYFFIIYGK